jgi:hypothetical protein
LDRQKTISARTAGVTFPVSAVQRATEPYPAIPYGEAITYVLSKLTGPLEAYSQDTKRLINSRPNNAEDPIHQFVYALTLAYDRHYPLTLSPDMIWLLIVQGFAQHVNANAETLRDRFVAHSGKVKLEVIRDHFVRGFAGNDWEGVFSEFSSGIEAHVGSRTHGLVMREFSTTGIVEKAAFEVTLMDTVQSYFTYVVLTRCGIPEITLEGTEEDWAAVRAGAAALADFDLDWWMEGLLPVLDQFVAASRGDYDTLFWPEFYKIERGSGGSCITGYTVNFFPYLSPGGQRGNATSPRRNPYLGWREPGSPALGSIQTDHLPSLVSVAPFIWKYHGKSYPMAFVAGFIGVAQDAETLALRPEIGWAVCEEKTLTIPERIGSLLVEKADSSPHKRINPFLRAVKRFFGNR